MQRTHGMTALAIILHSIALAAPSGAAVLRVRAGAPGPAHDGTTWVTAYTAIQPALDAAQPGDEVWVAGGESPYSGFVGSIVLQTPDVGLYGGFQGTETDRSERWPDARTGVRANEVGRPTITIVYAATNAIVDGFQVTGGSPGIYAWTVNATISNNRITDNGSPDSDSGGIECRAPGPVNIVDNVIARNRARGGAGILVHYISAIVLRNEITDNSAGGYLSGAVYAGVVYGVVFGGGIKVEGGSAVIRNNLIAHNASVAYTTYPVGQELSAAGGGLAFRNANVTLVNNTIADNLCAGQDRVEGGGLYATGTATVTNNIFASNRVLPIGTDATTRGGGLRVPETPPDQPANNVQARRNLFFDNAPDDGIPMGTNGNIHTDPRFVGWSPYFDQSYHLRPESPAIDAGDNASLPPGDTDLDRGPRLLGPSVDLGAYESQVTTAAPTLARVYVRSDADDRNTGASWAAAKRSIGAAVLAAAPGAEVWVARGRYPERVTLRERVSLLGGFTGSENDRSLASPWTVASIIDAGHRGTAVTVMAAQTTVDGFTITGGGELSWRWRETRGGGIECRGDRATITRNIIQGNVAMSTSEDPVTAEGGGLYAEGITATIANNIIRDNRAFASTYTPLPSFGSYAWARGGGLALVNVNATVANNLLEGNRSETEGNVVRHWAWGAGLYAAGCTGLISNNTVVANGLFPETPGWDPSRAANGTFFLDRSSAALTVANNIIAFNGGGVERKEDNALFGHNDVFGNGRNFYGPDPTGSNGNLSAEPLFANRSAGDFRLLPLSPCVDAGENAARWGETDLDGHPRVLNGTVDMGAYESPLGTPYTLVDAASALRIAAGSAALSSPIAARLNVQQPDTTGIDLLDAIALARKAAGLDANP